MDRRKIYGVIMLAVILPTLFLSTFHHHHPVSEDHCINCADHIPHSHLGGASHTGDCLVCAFLAVVWLKTEEESQEDPVVDYCFSYDFSGILNDEFCLSGIPQRAPPFVSC